MGLYAMGKINNILESRGADPSKTPYYLVELLISYVQLLLTELSL